MTKHGRGGRNASTDTMATVRRAKTATGSSVAECPGNLRRLEPIGGTGRRHGKMTDRRWPRPARTVWDRVWDAVWDSLYFIPALYVLVALALSAGLLRWDEADPITLARSVSMSGTSTSFGQ